MARRFVFRLQTLLKVRELREREARRKVGAKQAEIARLDQLNRQTAQEIQRCQAELRGCQRGHLHPAELTRRRAWIAYLRQTIAQRQAQRVELVAQLEQLLREWRTVRTQHRIIEKLREKRYDEYRRELRRSEQAASDELARQLQVYAAAEAESG